jgi:septal ring factor EnvC (AmiA/AmiB activator)
MSDNPTRESLDSRSFEERVFARFDSLDGRLTALEEKVDSRLRETRPIWEAMQADLATVKDDMATVKVDLAAVKGEVKGINRRVMLLHEDNLRIRADHRELREQMENPESQRTP